MWCCNLLHDLLSVSGIVFPKGGLWTANAAGWQRPKIFQLVASYPSVAMTLCSISSPCGHEPDYGWTKRYGFVLDLGLMYWNNNRKGVKAESDRWSNVLWHFVWFCACVCLCCQRSLFHEHNRYMEHHRLVDQCHCRNGTGWLPNPCTHPLHNMKTGKQNSIRRLGTMQALKTKGSSQIKRKTSLSSPTSLKLKQPAE